MDRASVAIIQNEFLGRALQPLAGVGSAKIDP